MRLLQRQQSDGNLTLTTFTDDRIPPYAILSHTWGEDDEEVTFRDITEGVTLQKCIYKQKKGYRKIDFCANSAANDNLQYFWVDSCCIEKSSSAELQEAITSMFRWYQNAAKCYVYLSDVTFNHRRHRRTSSRPAWESAFRKSRWFTRGWTLQELLAPPCVEFFSADGHKLGSRRELDQLLQEVTGIAIDALRGKPLFGFSTSERMSWARGRDTKRKEDKAYSLFGIFDVSTYINYGEGEERAMGRLRREVDRRRGSQRTQKSHFMVPFGRNKNFVGRDAVLRKLLQKIPPSATHDDCQRTAIEGLGGIGKTQIALEAAYRVHKAHPDCSVFWVPAIDLTSFENAFREIGRLLQLPGIDEDKADVKSLVGEGLKQDTTGSWLLIIDNADDLDLLGATLANCLPFSRRGSILFTTRNHKLTAKLDILQGHILAVPEMSNAEAVDLIQKGLRKEQMDSTKSTQQLLGFLANIPLAIKQASAFMASNTNVTISDYLVVCESSDTDLIDMLSEEFEDHHRYRVHAKTQNPIATTWLISFEQISRYNSQAANLLKFICFLAEKNIPVSLLPDIPKAQMLQAIGTLKAYGFITERGTPDAFDMHRLVRLVMRNWLRKNGEWVEWYTNVAQRLHEAYPYPCYPNEQIWIKYLPQGQEVRKAGDTAIWKKHILLFKIAISYKLLGRYEEAEQLLRQIITLQVFSLGREHPDTLASLGNLGHTLFRREKYEEAETIFQQVLELSEKVLGKEHPNTLASLGHFGTVILEQKRYEEAEIILRRVLSLSENALGKEHPDTLTSLNHFGIAISRQKRYEEAEIIFRRALELGEKVLGKDHPNTLFILANLGTTISRQKRYEEGAIMFRRALELGEKVLGEEHPDTLKIRRALGWVLKRLEPIVEIG